MDHIAIMNKKWKLIEKILNGEKTIESRWYLSKKAPYNKIKPGETIYFKNAGEPVTAKATVKDILQFKDLTPIKIEKILHRYNDFIWKGPKEDFFEMIKNKKYCILIFLQNPKKVEPFSINKKGFGISAAWIVINSVDEIKKI